MVASTTVYGLVRVLSDCFCSVCLTWYQIEYINRDIWVEYCRTNELLNQAVLLDIESIVLYTTTVWVLYSQASRAISTGQLHVSLHFHIQPINVVVFNGSLGDIKSRGNLILR